MLRRSSVLFVVCVLFLQMVVAVAHAETSGGAATADVPPFRDILLSVRSFTDLEMDAAHERLFVAAGATTSQVQMYDFKGTSLGTLDNISGPYGMEIAHDILYVAAYGSARIERFDLATSPPTQLPSFSTGTALNPRTLFWAGERLWAVAACDPSGYSGGRVLSFAPDGTQMSDLAPTGRTYWRACPTLDGGSNAPNRLFVTEPGYATTEYDVTGVPTVVKQGTTSFADLEVLPGGDTFATGVSGSTGTGQYRMSDYFGPTYTYVAKTSSPTAVGLSDDGILATAYALDYTPYPRISFYELGHAGAFSTAITTNYTRTLTRGLELAPDGSRAFLITTESSNSTDMPITLRILDPDGDNIEKASDECDRETEDKDGFEDADGCLDPDNDGDGVKDADDNCPNLDTDNRADNDKDGKGDECDPDDDNDGATDEVEANNDTDPFDPDTDDDRYSDGPADPDGSGPIMYGPDTSPRNPCSPSASGPDCDIDHDGIQNSSDLCPNSAEDFDGFHDGDGCPDPDNDGDGVADAQDPDDTDVCIPNGSAGLCDPDSDGYNNYDDQCDNGAEDYDEFQDADGCPDPDNDQDGTLDGDDPDDANPCVPAGSQGSCDPDGDAIPNSSDGCDFEAEDFDNYHDVDGCPDPDNDGDGTPDESDPDDANGCVPNTGFPQCDADGDGVVNSADSCDTQAEDMDGYQDNDGCPDADNDGDGTLDSEDPDDGNACIPLNSACSESLGAGLSLRFISSSNLLKGTLAVNGRTPDVDECRIHRVVFLKKLVPGSQPDRRIARTTTDASRRYRFDVPSPLKGKVYAAVTPLVFTDSRGKIVTCERGHSSYISFD